MGKSGLILTYASRSNVSTLYLSADSDPYTQLTRLLCINLGWTMEDAASAVRQMRLSDEAERVLDSSRIRFDYRSSPTLGSIENSLRAYDEVFGDYPSLVVVDNITNVRTGLNEEDPFAGLEAAMEEFHDLARATGACFVGLHHVTGPFNDGDKPIPLSGIKGQIARVPEMVLTLHRARDTFSGSEKLRVSTVKNRSGRSQPNGLDFVELDFVGETMTIRDKN